jgi:hypothetical protein
MAELSIGMPLQSKLPTLGRLSPRTRAIETDGVILKEVPM